MFETKRLLDFEVLNEKFSDSVLKHYYGQKLIVNTISPNSYGISTFNKKFKDALCGSILALDGVYFALASILKGNGYVVENQGPHITYDTLEFANKNSLKVFFLGSTQKTLVKIMKRLSKEYPNISSATYSPPFKDKFDDEDNIKICQVINKFSPDILLIGMTCPKQEIWIHQNKDNINFKISLSIGGVFDWYAGNIKEIPQIWWDLKLGWLYRIIQRPEIIKRNYRNTGIFIKDLIKEVLRFEK